MAWTRQAVPFQASARFTPRLVALTMAAPTAVQPAADAQDTPVKVLLAAPLGRMVRCSRQLVPFHLSAREIFAPRHNRLPVGDHPGYKLIMI